MEMRTGASRRVESTFSSNVNSSIAGVAHSPTQLWPTPDPALCSMANKKPAAEGEITKILKLQEKLSSNGMHDYRSADN
jgi:hypothetical protein